MHITNNGGQNDAEEKQRFWQPLDPQVRQRCWGLWCVSSELLIPVVSLVSSLLHSDGEFSGVVLPVEKSARYRRGGCHLIDEQKRQHVFSLGHGMIPGNGERLRGTGVSERWFGEGGRVAVSRLMENDEYLLRFRAALLISL